MAGGGATYAVTHGSTVTRVVSALLWSTCLLVVADWGYTAVDDARTAVDRAGRGAAIADSLARTVAGGGDVEQALAAVESKHGALVAAAFASVSGGVDEFGIARGAELLTTKGRIDDTMRGQLGEHTRSLETAASDALKRGGRIAFSRLAVDLGDRIEAIAVPYRKAESDKEAAGAAGVVLKAPVVSEGSAPWRWAACLLAAVLVVFLVRVGLPLWVAGVAAMLVVLAAAIAAAPTLLEISGGSLDIVGASRLFPHEAAPAAAALAAADTWLLVSMATLALLFGALVEPLAWTVSAVRADPSPYMYVGPAVLATGVLVFVPFAVGVGIAFTDRGGTFVGMANYIEVVQSLTDEASVTHFWRTLVHTVIWTFSNVTLHVTIGLALAILLNRPDFRGRKLYRMLLIVPWAVPNYITALTWKWLFNTQYGPINAMLGALGVVPVDWLGESALTNFAANLATNVWLGFPFMMVISLGALQSIPAELYEAASIDGASGWQKFRHVTLPLLKPALFPAVILGTIWTFNAFNIIYLVSGGGPDHQTEILITEAYYLFTVLRRLGLAAAYSVLIFLLLLGYTLITNRLTQATEAVDR